MTTDKITKDQMIEAIQNSGYLIEQRVEDVLAKRGYAVETNDAYFDPETNKSREVDITAINGKWIMPGQDHFIFPYLLIECENNHSPVVFFRNNPRAGALSSEDIKISGLPLNIYEEGTPPTSIVEALELATFHHYCKGPYYTQYCSFQYVKNDKKWIATHPDTQHHSLVDIIKCLEYKISDHYAGYYLPDDATQERLNLQIYYPIIILQSHLYEAYESDGELIFEKKEHIQFRKQLINSNVSTTYQIDIISENYLPSFLELINQETEKIVTMIRHKWSAVVHSIRIHVENETGKGNESISVF